MVRVLRRNSSDQIRGRYFIDLSFGSLPCEGRGGLGRGAFGIGASRGHPLPASPCRRRGRGQSKSSRLKPRLQQRLVPGKKNAGMSRRFPWYWSRSLLDKDILALLSLLRQPGPPPALSSAAGPAFLGIARV